MHLFQLLLLCLLLFFPLLPVLLRILNLLLLSLQLPSLLLRFLLYHIISSALTTTRFAKVQTHQLHHIGLEQIHIPPGRSFRLGQRTRIRCEEGRGGTIDGLLRCPGTICGDLHRRLASGNIENCLR